MAVASREAALAEKRILIIEADSSLCEEWSNGLRDYGFKVAATSDGEDGYSKAEKAKPDLVLLRVELPNVNGYKIAKKLKENEALKDVPLVLLSSAADEKDFESHKKTRFRAQGYRKLPLAFDDLIEDVENLVGLPGPMMAEFQAEAVPADKFNELESVRSELLVQVDHLKEQLESKTQSESRLEARVKELESDLVNKAGAAAESLTSQITALHSEVEAIKAERDEAREELDSKKRIINKLKENITKLEGQVADGGAKAGELTDLQEELESKKKVIAKLKENLQRLEQNTSPNEALEAEKKAKQEIQDDLDGKKKVISKLKEKIEQLEKDLEASKTAEEELSGRAKTVPKLRERIEELEKDVAAGKDTVVRMKETIADLTLTADEAKRDRQKAMKEREEILEQRASVEKSHQKEIDQLKSVYEPKVALLKQTEKELDKAKEEIRQLDRKLDEEARKNRERDDEYEVKLTDLKREHQRSQIDIKREIEDLKGTIARLDDEKSKMEQRVVKAYRKLKADESQLEKVRKALEIAMGLTKVDPDRQNTQGNLPQATKISPPK